MYVFVQNKEGKPLMPTNPAKARILLDENKAKVVSRIPFIIKLTYDSTDYVQTVIGGMDTGSTVIGSAAIANGKVLYQSEVTLRQDVSGKMEQRAMYRRTRRGRKIRYRECRFNNRAASRRKGRLAPSLKSKFESHLREKNFVESILPVAHWKVELASFDIHKLSNPDVSGKGYQEGKLKDYYNIKAYVLARDNYTCQHCKGKSKDKRLHCHHIIWRSKNGTDTPDNLVCLCETCHDALHRGEFELSSKKSETKHATEVGVIKSQLKKCNWEFLETFGYETKYKREQWLEFPKTHSNDAVAICCEDNQKIIPDNTIYLKRHVSQGDYQQRKGKRSEIIIPTRKLFGLRKFDLVKTVKGIGIVKGKRSTGFFSISDIFGNSICDSVNIKKYCKRLLARTTTLIQLQRGDATAFLHGAKDSVVSCRPFL
jgi:RRXRR protein/HNH endonuclease